MHERAHGRVAAQPAQTLADRVRLGARGTASFGGTGVRAIREMRITARLTHRICTTNGQNDPIAKRNAPSGGPASWLPTRNPACSRALPMPEVGGPHQHRQEGAARGVGEHLGGAVQEGRRQHDPHRRPDR